MTTAPPEHPLTFVKGDKQYLGAATSTTQRLPFELAKSDFNEVLSSKNLTFLFGSGCSSHIEPKQGEHGIPAMAPLAQGILATDKEVIAEQYGLTADVKVLVGRSGH